MAYPVKTLTQLRPILTAFRKAAGLTQAQMAIRLGVTQQTYAQLEAKPESASIERLFNALRLLNVDIVLSQALGPDIPEGANERPAVMTGSPSVNTQRITKKRGVTPKILSSAARTKTAAAQSISNRRASTKSAATPGTEPVPSISNKRERW